MLRRLLAGAVLSLACVVSATAALPAAARTSTTAGTHKLIVAVETSMARGAEGKLAVLVLVSQDGGAPAGSLARPRKPLTVLQQNGGFYSVKAEVDSACTGTCAAPSYRISGSANHKLEVVANCRPKRSGFVCTRVRIVKVY